MVEIKVNPKVIDALTLAFPKPANSAKRALEKYVRVLTSMLLESLSRGASVYDLKFNLFSLSLHELANAGGQIGVKRTRLHAWLRDNDLALLKAVEIGSNLTGIVSKVAFTDLVELKWHEPEMTDNQIVIDGVVIDKQLLDNNAKQNAELFDRLYPEFDVAVQIGTLEVLFDVVEIDISSLQNYIQWLKEDSKHYKPSKLNSYMFQARVILAVAQHTSGKYYQRKKPSEFGRMYYAGTSVQNVNKQLRRAMLGNCWEYDIRSSVVAWKMGFADEWVKLNRPNLTVRQCFLNTLTYLEHKEAFIKNVQTTVFGNNSDLAEEFQLKLLKQAFTALSFGARKTAISWQDSNGEWVNSAISDIFQIKEERELFLNHHQVCGFIEEQQLLDAYLFEGVKAYHPHLLKRSYLQTQSGRSSKPKVIAYLYQQDETAVMNIVRHAMIEFNKTILANIHDAIIVKQRLTADDKHEIELRMQEQSGNPYWRLGATELKRWEPTQKEAKKEQALHKQRMAGFEAVAQSFKGILSRLGFGRS
jgi:hypothetical protein